MRDISVVLLPLSSNYVVVSNYDIINGGTIRGYGVRGTEINY